MLTALADSLLRHLIEHFPARRSYAPAAFEREPMPPSVAQYLNRLLQRRLRHEAAHLAYPSSPWFDTGHVKVERAWEAFAGELAQHGHFPAETWEAALREAVRDVTAYLVEPTATLSNFVFKDTGRAVPVEVVEQRLGYFQDYGYLREAVRLYFRQKQLPEIDRPHFGKLLRHIDRRITKDYDAEAWLRLLTPLFDLARRARPEAAAVPVDQLVAFFEDKDAEVLVQRIQEMSRRQGLKALDEAGLRRALTAMPEEEPALPEPQPDERRYEAPARPAVPEPAPAASSNGAVPLWKQFQQGSPRPAPAPAPAARSAYARPSESRSQPVEAASTEAVPRWMQFRKGTPTPAPASQPPRPSSAYEPAPYRNAEPAPRRTPEPAPQRPAASTAQLDQGPDLERLEREVLGETGVRNRSLFVHHLFGGSEADYEQVLRRLYASPDWSTASKIIAEDIFRRHQVNIYSDPAVAFTDAAEARFD